MKERIDHSNYEAWLLDRLEGNLTPEQERALTAFLALHPELDPGEGDLPTVAGDAGKLAPLDKEALKRSLPPTADVEALNVEDHLIARIEGDLTAEQAEALRLFLLHHPEHGRAERLYAAAKIVPEGMAFARKRDLLRALPPQGLPTRFTLDDFLVARLEGELTPEQEQALGAYLARHPEAARAWELMQATKVRASDLVFADKASLKKGGRVIAITATHRSVRLAAAASIALLLGLAWWWARPASHGTQVADGEKVNTPVNGRVHQPGTADSIPSTVLPRQAMPVREQRTLAVEGTREQLGPRRSGQEQAAPLPTPPFREEPLPVAEQHDAVPGHRPQVPAPHHVPEVPEHPEEALAMNTPQGTFPVQQEAAHTMGQALAATLRERMLGRPAGDARPLDGDDAVAAVDKGLKAVGGEHAGLSVARDGAGRNRGFNLRLGRNLAISASR